MGNASQVYSRYRKEIREITDRYPVTNVRVFGSVCSGQLIPDSILRFSSAATGEMPSLNA